MFDETTENKEQAINDAMDNVIGELESYWKRKINARRKAAKEAGTLAEKVVILREIRALEHLRSTLRMNRFDIEDKMLGVC